MGGVLTVRDVCDIAYEVLRGRVERQALTAQTVYATYEASGRFEMHDEMPTVDQAVADFDAALEADVAVTDVRDRELLELMGVA